MYIPGRVISYFLLSTFLFVSTAAAQGDRQPMIEPSFDVVLQLVIGTDDRAAGQPLPQNLGNVVKQLRGNYSFAEYRLSNTYLGRLANGGNFEFKSLSTIFGRGAESETPSFLDWSLHGLRAAPNASGRSDIAVGFRFGARIPIKVSTREEGGKQFPVFNYESIGLNAGRVSLPENTPTLLGTLSLPNTNNTMFVVVTFKPA
jgi:hypothetical protein